MPHGTLDIIDTSRNSVTLSWLPPLHDGGAAVSAYVIERRDVTGAGAWSRVARVKPQTTTYTVGGLSENVEYSFRVFAENMEGGGAPLVMERTVAPRRAAGRFRFLFRFLFHFLFHFCYIFCATFCATFCSTFCSAFDVILVDIGILKYLMYRHCFLVELGILVGMCEGFLLRDPFMTPLRPHYVP